MRLWVYTDDLVVGVIIGTWAFGKLWGIITGVDSPAQVETEYMTMCLGYVFGNIVQKAKLAMVNQRNEKTT